MIDSKEPNKRILFNANNLMFYFTWFIEGGLKIAKL